MGQDDALFYSGNVAHHRAGERRSASFASDHNFTTSRPFGSMSASN